MQEIQELARKKAQEAHINTGTNAAGYQLIKKLLISTKIAKKKIWHFFSLKVKSPSLSREAHIWPHKNGVQLAIFGPVLWHGFGGICYPLGYKRGFGLDFSDPSPWGWNQSLPMRIGKQPWPSAYFLRLLHEEKEARGQRLREQGGGCSSGGRVIAPVTWRMSVWDKNSSWSYVCGVWIYVTADDLKYAAKHLKYAAKHPFVMLWCVAGCIHDNLKPHTHESRFSNSIWEVEGHPICSKARSTKNKSDERECMETLHVIHVVQRSAGSTSKIRQKCSFRYSNQCSSPTTLLFKFLLRGVHYKYWKILADKGRINIVVKSRTVELS